MKPFVERRARSYRRRIRSCCVYIIMQALLVFGIFIIKMIYIYIHTYEGEGSANTTLPKLGLKSSKLGPKSR
jgi:hypothetical protein